MTGTKQLLENPDHSDFDPSDVSDVELFDSRFKEKLSGMSLGNYLAYTHNDSLYQNS